MGDIEGRRDRIVTPQRTTLCQEEEGKKKEGEDEGHRGGNGVADRGKI